jgi:hypothetical protein
LAECFGADVAAELREWARDQLGKRVFLADPQWKQTGKSGAVLARVRFVADGDTADHRSFEERVIVKAYPPGDRAAETGKHARALEVDPAFAEQHLVKQKYARHRMRNGRIFAFQEIPFDLNEAYPLTEVAVPDQPALAKYVAQMVLVKWNKADKDCHTKLLPPHQYLQDELRGALKSGHETHDWAQRTGLLEPGLRWITLAGDDPDRPCPTR